MQQHDGHAENPTAVVITADGTEYQIQFHSGDTIFYKSVAEWGSTGPYYDVHKLPFSKFSGIYQKIGFPAVMLLPMVALKPAEIDAAAVLITRLLSHMQLKAEHLGYIADMIAAGPQP